MKLILRTIEQDLNKAYQKQCLNRNQIETNKSTMEKEIDQMVYELYGLTAEDIGIIENLV